MSSTKDVKYVKYGNRTEEEWNALQEERRPEVYELLNKLGYNHKADVANLKVYQTANGFDIQDGITDQVYGAIRRDAALKGVLTNNEGSTIPPSAPASDSATNYSDYSNLLDYADAYKSSAYANASALRGASYEAALKARQEAEALAEIQRKRGIVDASTMAEQQKATYGANAEQLGRMGLNVSGYSDYLNSQAYASGMAARQNANAQATDIKRQATYQEALARLEADKAYSQATAEADKTYYEAMKEIEAKKIADAKALEERQYKEQQQKEAQQQTNYGNLIDAIVNSNGVINKDNVETFASSLGITDTKLLGDATNFATTYVENTPETLTDKKIADLTATRDAQMIAKDYVGAAKTNAQITYPNATPEQLKLYESADIVSMMDTISSDPSSWSSIANNLANYGDNGAKNIKEAFSNSEYVSSAESLGKNELKAVIDSGLLTDEAKSRLEAMYTIRFDNPKQINIYEFSKYAGADKESSKQSAYIDAIKSAVDAEKKASNGTNEYADDYEGLKVGDVVDMNYGIDANKILTQLGGGAVFASLLNTALYEYKGNGVFEPVKGKQWTSADKDKLYIPEGYRRNALGQVKKKK